MKPDQHCPKGATLREGGRLGVEPAEGSPWDETTSGEVGDTLRELKREIAERQRAENELRQREARLLSIFSAAPVGIGLVVDRVIMDANERLCEMLGYRKEELLGKSARVLYQTNEDYEFVGREKYAQISTRGTGTVETQWVCKDGRIIDVILSSTPLDVKNWSAGVTFTALDITDRNRAEAVKLDLERRLLHAQKLESLGILAGGIAHDFNNLLMVILGNLDLALQDLPPFTDAHASIEQAVQAARKATELTRQMLAYSGKGQFLVSCIDLNDLVQENAELFRTAVGRHVTINVSLTTRRAMVEADAGQIQQVIMNLITNGSEAIGDRPGTVTLVAGVTECDEDRLRQSRLEPRPHPGSFAFLEVSDTGLGMDATTLERLFDPFFTTKFTGRGLGMSAVLGIVRGHKGAIFVNSEEGRGTSVQVLFPESHSESAPVERSAHRAPSRQESDAPCGTILVVDDEADVRSLCMAFVRRLGFQGIAAADGEEALAAFQQHVDDITCVLLDLTMPRMDGVSAFRRMKELRPHVRVLLSSGYNEQEATQRFTGEGLAGFIQKPYRLEELRLKIKAICELCG